MMVGLQHRQWQHQHHHQQRAFTLVELLVVISIIALLIAILLPSLKRAREQSKDVVCKANMKQLGISNKYYSGDNQDRFMLIERRDDIPSASDKRPFLQYQQIGRLVPYLKQLEVYICPKAKGGRLNSFGWNPLTQKPPGSPNSILGWNTWSLYKVQVSDDLFLPLWKRREFPKYSQADLTEAENKNGGFLDDLYTEYWVNDWGDDATDPNTGRKVPAISGGLVNRIPYPNYAVVMADAVRWNPRHREGSHFLFVDTHVDYIKGEEYYDPLGRPAPTATDKDPFGNFPHWAWGLGRNFRGR